MDERGYIIFEVGGGPRAFSNRLFLRRAFRLRQATSSMPAADDQESASPALNPNSDPSAGVSVGKRMISHSAAFPQRSIALTLTLTSLDSAETSQDH